MEQAIIDIGSNSIRLTVYETEDRAPANPAGTRNAAQNAQQSPALQAAQTLAQQANRPAQNPAPSSRFKILFREKIMAGLANYVENGNLSTEGIRVACNALLDFRNILQALQISAVHVFATASLRNIENTSQAVATIYAQTGFTVEVLSGEEEALLGYAGVMQTLQLTEGTFLDVGGASTEVVSFSQNAATDFTSFPIGSLSLYKRCVKNILPGEGSLRRLRQTIGETIDPREQHLHPQEVMVGVGGTARAALKMSKHLFSCSKDCTSITAQQIDQLSDFLCSGTKEATSLILRLEADRVHTIVPGMLILQHVFHLFEAKQLIVSKYGVREGYLCQKILKK